MTDRIIKAINAKHINFTNISFDFLRRSAATDHDIRGELRFGHHILTSVQQLDQYLYTYGPMIRSQWRHFLCGVSLPPGPFRVIDYGCGQGLGSVLLFDHLGSSVTNQVTEVILIEPSEIALTRAFSIISCYCSKTKVIGINRKLDDLTDGYFTPINSINTIHLFSNILDIASFEHDELFCKILRVEGRHTILAVGHDRNFDGGSERIRDLDKWITDPKLQAYFTLPPSPVINQFACSNRQPAISWQLHFEIPNGSV